MLGGLGLVLLSTGVGSHSRHAEAESPPGAVSPDGASESEGDDPAGGEPVAEAPTETATEAATESGSAPSLEQIEGALALRDAQALARAAGAGPLAGHPGAATALAVRDYATALALVDAEPVPVEGSAAWFRHGALRGRALRHLGRPADAVAELEPRLADRALPEHFPKDALGLELVRARVQWANGETLSVDEADAQREQAVRELGRLRKEKSLRNLAVMRVLQAEAMGSIEGSTPRDTTRAAKKAAAALERVVVDYPNHPRIGPLRLAHARALRRAGKDREAASALRRIAIERAGEPEAEQAWAELESLAAERPKVKASPLSFGEQLEAAMFARGLRRVKASREILDTLLADPDLSANRQRQVRRSRSYTAYKQRDYATCVDDLGPIYEATRNGDVRAWLLRCMERGEMYDDALALWQRRIDSDRRGTRTAGLWSGLTLAFKAGRYAQAQAWLTDYEALSRGHAADRRWLRPWLAYRLGRDAEAIEGFGALARGYSGDARRATYFLGKLLVTQQDPALRAEGVTTLQQLAAERGWGYYGLMARQRLLDAGAETPPLPPLPPVAEEARRPTRAVAERRLAELDARFGEAWPSLRRARQLFEAGYVEPARRELRYTIHAYVGATRGKQLSPRSEALLVGLGWKAEWDYPRARTTAGGRKTLRNKEEAEALRQGLWRLAHDLSEPHSFAKLATSADGPSKARWHPRAYRASVEREARLRKIDPLHMWSLMYTESRFRRHVVSPVGARGALQIMPWTGRQLAERLGEMPPDGRFDPDVLFDIDTNAHLAGYYVSELLYKFHGQAPMAYASYNGGPSNVGRWLRAKSREGAPLELDTFIEEIVFSESYRYTKRVVEVSAAYSMLYRGQLPRWSNEVDPVVEDNIAF